VLRPATPGSVTLEATFNVREGASFTVLISDERTQITEIALTLPAIGSGDDYLTFNRYKNTMVQSVVQVKFDDGTQLADASIMNSIPSWCPISSLLLFASDYPEAVPFDVEGGLTLLDNHWDVVELIASVACNGSSVDDSKKHIYANLLAPLDDVDLGQRTGLQFQQYGDTLEIAVRANVQASNSRLVTYQIDVFFDTAAFEFVSDSCKAGEPGDFDCAGGAYDGDGRVRMLGTDFDSTLAGPDVLIGTFTLSVKAAAVSLIDGTIEELVRYQSGGHPYHHPGVRPGEDPYHSGYDFSGYIGGQPGEHPHGQWANTPTMENLLSWRAGQLQSPSRLVGATQLPAFLGGAWTHRRCTPCLHFLRSRRIACGGAMIATQRGGPIPWRKARVERACTATWRAATQGSKFVSTVLCKGHSTTTTDSRSLTCRPCCS
jgi:hypothetical protein